MQVRVLIGDAEKMTHPTAATAARGGAETAGEHEVGAALAPRRLLRARVAAGRRHVLAACVRQRCRCCISSRCEGPVWKAQRMLLISRRLLQGQITVHGVFMGHGHSGVM